MILTITKDAIPHPFLKTRKAGTEVSFVPFPHSIDMYTISGTPYIIGDAAIVRLMDAEYLV